MMQFHSIPFLFCFMPVFFGLYYAVPSKAKCWVLLIGSLLFYGMNVWQSPWAILLLVLTTLLSYFAARVVEARRYPWIFWPVIGTLLGVLVFFKCFLGGKLLPVGMSFYLFQLGAYLMQQYRGGLEAEKNFLHFATGIWMFPKLLCGPLVDPAELKRQIAAPQIKLSAIRDGLQELVVGLGIKVILANRIGTLWAQAGVVGYAAVSTPFAWLALISFALKLYLDFYSYCIMACGLGKMLGFSLPQNFDAPYAASSIRAFYRRWHITLGLWFRIFVYIPLGGSRCTRGRTALHLALVWLLTGLWHGVGGNYLLWAGFLGGLVILERLWLGKWLEKLPVLGHFYTVFAIALSWVPFAITDGGQMLCFFGRLFAAGQAVNPWDFLSKLQSVGLLLLPSLFLATPWPKRWFERVRVHWWVDVLLLLLFWLSVFCISTSAQDSFAYFQY